MNERHVRIKICISLYALFSFWGGRAEAARMLAAVMFFFFSPHREKVLAKFV